MARARSRRKRPCTRTQPPVVVEYAHPKPLLRNNYLDDRGFTWVVSSESDNAHRYAVYLRAQGYTTALQLPASPAAFYAGHLDVQEHGIAVDPQAHVLRTGVNLLTNAAAEHDVVVSPPAHPLRKGHHYTGSAHRAALHTPAPYQPPLLPPRPLDFNEGAQPPTAWGMASYIYQMDRPRPPAPRNSAAPGQHLPAMAAPYASQATQDQAYWYEHMALDHSQERISHPCFISHDHAHIYLTPGGSRGWPFLLRSPSQCRWPQPISSSRRLVLVPEHRPPAYGVWTHTASLPATHCCPYLPPQSPPPPPVS